MFNLIWLVGAVWALSLIVSGLVFLFYGLSAGLSRPRQRQPVEASIGPVLGVLAFGAVLVSVETEYWWIGAAVGVLYLAACFILGVPSRARALGRWYTRRRVRRRAV